MRNQELNATTQKYNSMITFWTIENSLLGAHVVLSSCSNPFFVGADAFTTFTSILIKFLHKESKVEPICVKEIDIVGLPPANKQFNDCSNASYKGKWNWNFPFVQGLKEGVDLFKLDSNAIDVCKSVW